VARFALLVSATVAADACGGDSPPAEVFETQELVADLLGQGTFWTSVREHPALPPEIDILTPSPSRQRDGSGIPALVLAPPAEVTFDVAPEHGPSILRARVGVDVAVVQHLPAQHPAVACGFEVLVDGESVFATRIRVERNAKPLGTSWVTIGGEVGLPLRGGEVVTLRTSLFDHRGETLDSPIPVRAGFGRMLLERPVFVERTRSTPETPNLVVVVQDTLRVDRLSVYGYERATSPHLERQAARGLTYEAAYSTSNWTWPSTASILTGMHPQQHGVLDQGSCFLSQQIVTVAEVLQRGGFTTAAWSGNPLITDSRNFSQGFELFRGSRDGFRKSDEFFSEVEAWIESHAGSRFMLYLHLVDPHAPYVPLPEARKRIAPHAPPGFDMNRYKELVHQLRRGEGHDEHGAPRTDALVSAEEQAWYSDLYDACVWSGDYWLGKLLDQLERLGLDDETVVVFTSDHGEELFDRGFLAHGHTIYGELVRVPLVLAGPGIDAGARIDTPVSNRHLAPTLARLGGVSLTGATDPIDLILETNRNDPRSTVFFSTRHGWWSGNRCSPMFGLRVGNDVLHYAPDGKPWPAADPAVDPRHRLFDLAADPRETTDLGARESTKVERLRTAIEKRVESLERLRPARSFGAGEATMELLRGIGYVDDGDGG